MAEDLKNSPSYCNESYKAQKPAWDYMADVCSGTLHLRECSSREVYLPREPAEKDQHYNYRRNRAILFNAVERTLNGLVGLVFRKDPKLSDDVPVEIKGREASEGQSASEGYWENIDNAGTHGDVFCKEVFTDALKFGHSAILVDMPPRLEDGATLADERASGRRPYWVSYRADQVINWRTEVVNGQTRLVLVVLRECSKEADGEYGEKEVIRYRVLKPGSWELYKEVKGEGQQMDIIPDPDNPGGSTSLAEIPLAVVYSRKIATLVSKPPLLDLAVTNIAHYQKYSDFSIYEHIASRPILCREGADPNKPVTQLSAYTIMDHAVGGSIYFAESTGAALGVATQDIKDLEQRMSVMGLSLLSEQTAGEQVTATEERNDQIEESSDLATAKRSMEDAIELCLKFTAQFMNPSATTGGSIEIALPEEATLTAQDAQAVYQFSQGIKPILSAQTTRQVLKKSTNWFPPDWEPDAEDELIGSESTGVADALLSNFEKGAAPPL